MHLVDTSDADPERQIASVREVLAEIGAEQVDEIVVFNKTDAASPEATERLRRLYPEAAFTSALTGDGVDDLLDAIVAGLDRKTIELAILVPYERGDVLAEAHKVGEVLDIDHNDAGTAMKVRLPHAEAHRFRAFVA